jgi:hypothetical protein
MGLLRASEEQIQALYKYCLLRARDILQHEWVWPRVEALAADLLQHGTLTEKQVHDAIARANQQTRARYGPPPPLDIGAPGSGYAGPGKGQTAESE